MPSQTSFKGKNCQMAVEGELTIFSANELLADFKAAFKKAKQVELDLSQVTEIDTAGLQLLLAAKRQSQMNNTSMRIVAHSVAVQELFNLSDVVAYFGDPLVIESQLA